MVDGAASLASIFYGMTASGRWSEPARRQPARRRRALLRHLRDGRRQVRVDRRAGAEVLCRDGRAHRPGRALHQGPARPQAVARDARRDDAHPARQDARRVVRSCSKAATPASRRCSASTRRRSTRMPGRGSAFIEVAGVVQPGAGAALRPQHARSRAPGAGHRRAHRRGAGRGRLQRRRDRRAACRRRGTAGRERAARRQHPPRGIGAGAARRRRAASRCC